LPLMASGESASKSGKLRRKAIPTETNGGKLKFLPALSTCRARLPATPECVARGKTTFYFFHIAHLYIEANARLIEEKWLYSYVKSLWCVWSICPLLGDTERRLGFHRRS